MATEIRSIIFRQTEACALIAAFLETRGGRQGGARLARVRFAPGLSGVEARLTWNDDCTTILDAEALLSAMLLDCWRTHLPLPQGGVKSVAFSDDSLILVIVTNRRTLEADCLADHRAAALAKALARDRLEAEVPIRKAHGT